MTESEAVFVRKSSGLVRSFGTLDSFLMNVTGPILSLAIIGSIGLGVFADPSGDVVWGIFITLLLGSAMALMYGMMSIIMPRSGGEYIYVSRTLNPALGFATNWLFAMMQLFYIGFNGWLMATSALPVTLIMLGWQLNIPSLESAATSLYQPLNAFIVGAIITTVVMLIPLVGMRRYAKFQLVLAVIGFAGIIAALVTIVTAGQSSFISSFNAFANHLGAGVSDPYHWILTTANSSGFTSPVETMMGTIRDLPAWYWSLLYPCMATTFIAGEIKSIKKTQLVTPLAALLTVGIFVAVTAVVTTLTCGKDFYYALYYLYHIPPGNYFLGAIDPNYTFIASVLTHNVALLVLIFLGFFTWMLNGDAMCAIWLSRIFFAWSFDGLLPKRFADVHPKYHVPVLGFIIAWIGGLIMMAAWVEYATVFFSVGTTLFQAIIWIVVATAAIVLPFKSKKLLEASGVNYKIGGVSVLTIVGAITLVFNLIMASFIAIFPEWAISAVPTIVPMIIVYIIGFIIFYAFRAHRKSHGIDIDLAYKVLPPE